MNKKIGILFIVMGFVLVACGTNKEVTQEDSVTPAIVSRQEKGGKDVKSGKWDKENKIVAEHKGIKFFAYLSKDKKECWVYKIKAPKDFTGNEIIFPEKIQNVAITKLGGPSNLEDGEAIYDIWGRSFEPYHNFSNGDPTKNGVKKIQLPDTVQTITAGAFGGLKHLEEITLPEALKKIDCALFYDCKSLVTITMGSQLKSIEKNSYGTFERCKKLTEFIVSEENPKYCSVEGMIASKDKTELILVPTARKKVDVPNGIKKIEELAFLPDSYTEEIHISVSVEKISTTSICGKRIRNIVIADKNIHYAISNHSLYEKKSGMLITYVITKSVAEFPPEVTRIANDFNTIGDTDLVRTIVVPVTVKHIGNHFFGYGNWGQDKSKIDVKFLSSTPPDAGKDMIWPSFTEVELYVPEESVPEYKNWLKKMEYLDDEERTLIRIKAIK